MNSRLTDILILKVNEVLNFPGFSSCIKIIWIGLQFHNRTQNWPGFHTTYLIPPNLPWNVVINTTFCLYQEHETFVNLPSTNPFWIIPLKIFWNSFTSFKTSTRAAFFSKQKPWKRRKIFHTFTWWMLGCVQKDSGRKQP